jgi:hypothetical protein
LQHFGDTGTPGETVSEEKTCNNVYSVVRQQAFTDRRIGHCGGGREQRLIPEDRMKTIREGIDWTALVLNSMKDCRDEDTMSFAIQKVIERLHEMLRKQNEQLGGS